MMAQSFPLLVAAGMGDLLSFTFGLIISSAIAFAIIVGVASYLRFQLLTQPLDDDAEGDLATDDVFQLKVIQRIGGGTRTPEPFGLALIRPKEGVSEERLKQAVEEVDLYLRTEDVVQVNDDGQIAIILTTHGARVDTVVQRLAELPKLKKILPDFQVASVCFPENGSRFVELMDALHEGLSALDESGDVLHHAVREDVEEDEQDQSDMLDELTGVLKPERLLSALQKYVARHRKDATPVSLLYIDVDYLDRYNRHYGEEGGDAVLRQLGHMIESQFRETDLVGRYEGEEFLIALSCRAHKALIAAQRFAADVKKYPFEFGNTKLKITVSIGVAGFPEHGNVPRELFDRSSAALLAAKNLGRGRAAMFEVGMPTLAELEKNVERI